MAELNIDELIKEVVDHFDGDGLVRTKNKKISYQKWLKTDIGRELTVNVYVAISLTNPTNFEIQRQLRRTYEDWKMNRDY